MLIWPVPGNHAWYLDRCWGSACVWRCADEPDDVSGQGPYSNKSLEGPFQVLCRSFLVTMASTWEPCLVFKWLVVICVSGSSLTRLMVCRTKAQPDAKSGKLLEERLRSVKRAISSTAKRFSGSHQHVSTGVIKQACCQYKYNCQERSPKCLKS